MVEDGSVQLQWNALLVSIPCDCRWQLPEYVASAFPFGCVRGRERHGSTQSHPEPGRAPWQRRRVLHGEPCGRRGRCAHSRGDKHPTHSRILTHRGVEQWQLVGLITQRSWVRIPPPLPNQTSDACVGGLAISSCSANLPLFRCRRKQAELRRRTGLTQSSYIRAWRNNWKCVVKLR